MQDAKLTLLFGKKTNRLTHFANTSIVLAEKRGGGKPKVAVGRIRTLQSGSKAILRRCASWGGEWHRRKEEKYAQITVVSVLRFHKQRGKYDSLCVERLYPLSQKQLKHGGSCVGTLTLTILPNQPISNLRFTLTAISFGRVCHGYSEIRDWSI